MITLHLIGIGTGNPDHVTLAAIEAMNGADLILLPRKGVDKSDLADLRRTICERVLTSPVRIVEFDQPQREARDDYLGAVDDWHTAIAAVWAERIAADLPEGGHVALLVWGDPSLYDSSLRIAGRLSANGMAMETRVVPGITSLQVLTAAHGIPLNRLGAPVLVTTGRRLRETGWPAGVEDVAVMLDAGGAFEALDPDGIHICWGAYLGMAHEHLLAGPLAEAGATILAERRRLRARHGWIMDVYLLRRGGHS